MITIHHGRVKKESSDKNLKLIKEPVYQQLSNALKSMITSGEFKIGEKFLTERAISERFEVSRTTANKAVANLISSGILEYKQGRGTFIKGASLTHDLGVFLSSTRRIKNAGMEPSTKIIFFREIFAKSIKKDVKKLFLIDPQEKVFYFKRIRFADEIPVLIETHYFRKKYMPDLTKEKVAGSLFALTTAEYGLDIIGYKEIIHSEFVKGKNAELLDVSDGTPGFHILNIGYITDEIPLYFTSELCSHHVYEFHHQVWRNQSQRPIGRIFKDL